MISVLLSFLQTRRSTAIADFKDGGPTSVELETILSAATRVPDHGKYAPWYLIVFSGDNRAAFGDIVARAWATREPHATPEKLATEAARMTRAAVVIAVISRPKPLKHPVWEQQLSAGALCYNLCLAANALGYGSNWLTEWVAYDPIMRQELHLHPEDAIAGFIYIGTADKVQAERVRPDLTHIVTHWQPGCIPARGPDAP
ncbi:MAG: nitroreductase [Pseudomonadota bacterium]